MGGIHDRLAHITGRVGKLADHCVSDWSTDTTTYYYAIRSAVPFVGYLITALFSSEK